MSDSNLNSERGFSLISALISAAIMGVLVVMLATLNDNMSKAMLRSNMQRAADNLQRQIAGVMGQRNLCSRAIRHDALGTTRLRWLAPYGPLPIPFILLDGGSGTKSVLASKVTTVNGATGKPYNQVMDGLFIEDITLQTRDINNDGNPDPAVENEYSERDGNDVSAKNLVAVPAEIRIKYRGAVDSGGNPLPGTAWVGGAFKTRAIPVVVVMDRDNSNVIDRCDEIVAANRLASCTGPDARVQALTDMNVSDCPPATCPPELPIRDPNNYIVVLSGYRSDGKPLCACQVICQQLTNSWKDDAAAVPNSGQPFCTVPSGHACSTLGAVCIRASAGGGLVYTRTCSP